MSMLEDNFSKLFDSDEDYSNEKLIATFFDGKNINGKTEIPKRGVIFIACLEAYADELQKVGLKDTAKFVRTVIRIFKELMVSADREGRREAVSMMGAIREQIRHSGILGRIFGAEKG